MKSRMDVNVECPVPIGGVHFEKSRGKQAARAVYQHVCPTQLVFGFVNEAAAILRPRHIARGAVEFSAE